MGTPSVNANRRQLARCYPFCDSGFLEDTENEAISICAAYLGFVGINVAGALPGGLP
jgi:hypothetical protein